jgi:hypothetical protein
MFIRTAKRLNIIMTLHPIKQRNNETGGLIDLDQRLSLLRVVRRLPTECHRKLIGMSIRVGI